MSCLAPILRDIFLAHYDRRIGACMSAVRTTKVFRYVDNYLVLIDSTQDVSDIVHIFTHFLDNLVIIHELPLNNAIQFVDLRIFLFEDMCVGIITLVVARCCFRISHPTLSW